MTWVFVHIPKAAGTSLKNALESRFGAEHIHYDYQRPMARPAWRRNLDCAVASCIGPRIAQPVVFGHFLAGKYARFTGRGFVPRSGSRYLVFLRDPLQRAVSHYLFWKRTHLGGHRIWERFSRENWSLERFLLGSEHADFQSQFLWRFPIEQFDFIGLAEHYSESLQLLGGLFPEFKTLEYRADNCNTAHAIASPYRVDPGTEAEFKVLNRGDYALYARAKAWFSETRAVYSRSGEAA